MNKLLLKIWTELKNNKFQTLNCLLGDVTFQTPCLSSVRVITCVFVTMQPPHCLISRDHAWKHCVARYGQLLEYWGRWWQIYGFYLSQAGQLAIAHNNEVGKYIIRRKNWGLWIRNINIAQNILQAIYFSPCNSGFISLFINHVQTLPSTDVRTLVVLR